MPRYIRHVTLTTGHARNSMAGEVPAETIAQVRASLALALSGPQRRARTGVDLPAALAVYEITATAAGRCLIVTVWHDDAPVCTIGVAGHARCGAELWRLLHRQPAVMPPLATDPEQQPQPPWIGARLDIGVALHSDAAHWLGSYESCLGWAWLAELAARRTQSDRESP